MARAVFEVFLAQKSFEEHIKNIFGMECGGHATITARNILERCRQFGVRLEYMGVIQGEVMQFSQVLLTCRY